MKRHKRLRLALEQLEDRWVPTTVQVLGGTLLITNPTVGPGGVAAVTVTDTPAGLQVATVNGPTLTVGAADGIIYIGGLAKNDFTFDADGNSYDGNVYVLTNNGHNDSINIGNSSAGTTGQIEGNVIVLTGHGTDSIGINAAAGDSSFSILGNVQIDSLNATASLATGNANAPTTILGDFSALGRWSSATISNGSADTFLGSVTVDDTLASGSPSITIGNSGAAVTISENLAVYGNGAAATLNLPGLLTVNGSTVLNLGSGNSQFTTGANFFAGSFNLYGGDGNDSVTISDAGATFQSNAAINLGNGDNSFALGVGFTAAGNFSITAGNGDNAVGNATIGAENTGGIAGSLGLYFGSGDNDSITVNAPVGNTVFWRNGNGNSSLVIGSDTMNASNYQVNAVFGNGIENFGYFLNDTSLIGGIIVGGNGTNTLDPNSTPAITSALQLVNF